MYNVKKNNQEINICQMIFEMIGSKAVGPFWVIPYSIDHGMKNDEEDKLRKRFNYFSKIHLVILIETSILFVLYFL